MRKIRRKDPRPKPLKRQRDVLCDAMLSAGVCETWLTLVELSRVTHYGEASISAQAPKDEGSHGAMLAVC
jgi:hypothetical protein